MNYQTNPVTTRPDFQNLFGSAPPVRSIGLLSTFPPTPCGLATFASALTNGLESIGVEQVNVVRVTDDKEPAHLHSLDPHVISEWRLGSPASEYRTSSILNAHDAVIVQHEFGIFDGPDGVNLLSVLANIQAPIVTTLHTVPLSPSPNQQRILETVIDISASAVTMTSTARDRLLEHYDVDPEKIVTVPHGATVPKNIVPPTNSYPRLLTWGLLGPGKGIEWAIRAVALLRDRHPNIRYTIAGRTHPKVLAHEGERYRQGLIDLCCDLGVQDNVIFDDSYRTLDQLLELLSRTTCVVLPYDSMDQITSGVLVDAIAAGRPVIATNFPHALELLNAGAGIVCPHKDPDSIARAIHQVISSEHTLQKMHAAARDLAVVHSWENVAGRYLELVAKPTSAVHAVSAL